jgi:TonB family protein
MIILEFLVFVVSSGVFCSEKFRHHIWAVIVAGAIATGSSLLFVYDLGAKLAGHEKEPPVITKIVKQTVGKTIETSQPAKASAGKPHNCLAEYPSESLNSGEHGNTVLNFKILTDGTVDAVKVVTSSGSSRLDDAAVKCVAAWHYTPAIKNGQLVETTRKALVQWVLPTASAAKQEAAAQPQDQIKPGEQTTAEQEKPNEGHAWYDVGSWFSSDSDKAEPRTDKPADK